MPINRKSSGSSKKISNIRILIIILSLLLGQTIFLSLRFNGTDMIDNSSDIILPKESSSHINIITPENRTYTEPMSGYYPAIYGFEDEPQGTYGTDLSISDEWTGNMASYLRMYTLDGPYDDHNKVFTIFDSQAGGLTTGVHNFDNPQSSGTIEFWLRMEGAADVGSTDRFHQIHFRKSDNTIAFRAQLKMLEGGWVSGDRADVAYYNGASWVEFADGEDLAWYRHKIDFNCTESKYSWYIYHTNGSLLASITNIDFENPMPTLDEIYFTSITSHYRGATYWDAFGFDWEDNYNIGDNLNEGLLLGFNSNVTLDAIGYSLDGNPTKNILGNTTFVIPSNGAHTIQVFGDDSIGNPFQSELRYFTVSLATTNMYEPSLSDGIVSPFTGDQKTLFTFEVNYTDLDNNLPDFINVLINESEFMMIKQNPSDIDYTDGCIFQYSTYLNPSSYNYTYSFNCSDGMYSNSTSIFNNLEVLKTNLHEPQLLFPDVSPDIGGYNTIFNYTVWYFDEDNNQPDVINITIDQNTYLMSKHDAFDTNSTDGILYFYNTSLNFGYYQFQINCSDGTFKNSTNWIDGPEVDPFYTDMDVSLLYPLNMSSFVTNWVDFEWSSLEAPFGAVDYTFQISNVSDFSEIVFEQEDIIELPSTTNTSVYLNFPTGVYYWRVCPVFEPYIGNWSDYYIFDLSVNSFAPSLSFGSVGPTQGDQYTVFNFTVSYFDQDNNSPLYLNVIINGISHAMEKVNSLDVDFTDGCIYQYLTTLPYTTLNYTYSFNCSDGKYLYSSIVFNNLEVNEANDFIPQLLNPQFSPTIGGASTIFNFTVWYFDADDNLPIFINITIDSLDFSMFQHDFSDTNAIDGILFYFNTTLNIGIHSFMVECSDGKFTNSTELLLGPEVNPFIGVPPPTLLNPIYNAEIPAQSINFSWSSLNAPFGSVNYTLQISNTTNFITILYEITDIHETLDISEVQVDGDFLTGIYYWRVIANFGTLEGDWSNIFKFNILINTFAPILVSDTIFPSSGDQNTIFNFTAIYQDLDNNAPVFIRIIINGKPYLMEKQNPNDNNYIDGCIYQFLTILTPSEEAYTYSLECYDGAFYESTSTYQGPIVSDEGPIYDRNEGLNNRNAENILALSISLILGIGIVVPSIILTERNIRKNKPKSIIKSKTRLKPKN